MFNFLDLVIKIQSDKEDYFSSMLNPNLSLKILIIKILFIQEYIWSIGTVNEFLLNFVF